VTPAARQAIHPGYLLTPQRWERLCALVEAWWPAEVAPDDLLNPALWDAARGAHQALAAFVVEAAR
jgi:succinylarginine dihydrolase